MKNGKYYDAAILLVNPKDYNEQELKKEIYRIEKIHEIISLFSGEIDIAVEYPEECKYHITILTVDSLKEKNEPYYAWGRIPINFTNVGPGWIELSFYKKSIFGHLGVNRITYQFQTIDSTIIENIEKLGCKFEVVRTRDEILTEEYGTFVDSLNKIFYQDDPLGINEEQDSMFYWLEISYILHDLYNQRSESQVRDMLYDHYSYFLNEGYEDFDVDTSIFRRRLDDLSKEIWSSWYSYKNR